jgi:hypothetical protein
MIKSFYNECKDYEKSLGGLDRCKKETKIFFEKEKVNNFLLKKHNSLLEPGKIYTFNYNPENTEDVFDKKPTVLSLGRKKFKDGVGIDIALNLNYFKIESRIKILDIIDKVFKQNIIIAKRFNSPINIINYELVVKKILGEKSKYAIRTYYPFRRNFTYEVSYEIWYKVPYFDTNDLRNGSINEIQRTYNK